MHSEQNKQFTSVVTSRNQVLGKKSHTVFHHDGKELDDDLGAGSNENLPLASLSRVINRPESVVQHIHTHHGGGLLASTNSHGLVSVDLERVRDLRSGMEHPR